METANFPNEPKLAYIIPFYKNMTDINLVFYLLYLKYLNVVFLIKFPKTFDNILSKHQVGYRKGYGSQYFFNFNV